MANLKISELNTLGKNLFTSTDYILVARGNSSNAKVQANTLLPSLTNVGTGDYFLSLSNENAFSQKALKVTGGILQLAATNDLTLSINQGSINLNSCDNSQANFLKTVSLASNVVTGTLPVARGGTGLSSLTANSIMTVSSSGNMQSTALTTNGQLLIGGVSGPAAAKIQAGSNITVTDGDGSITIAATIPASVVTKNNNNIVLNNGGGLTAEGNITFNDSTKGLVYNAKNIINQETSLSTSVTINATAGKINIFSAALAAETQAEFTVNNSTVTASSLIFVTLVGPGISVEANTGYFQLHVSQIAAGSFKVVLSNTNSTHATDAGARAVQFLVIN